MKALLRRQRKIVHPFILSFSRMSRRRFPNSAEDTISISDSDSERVPSVRMWWRSWYARPSGWFLSLWGAQCTGMIVEHPCITICFFCDSLYQEHSALAGRIKTSNFDRKSFPRIKSIPCGSVDNTAHWACSSSVENCRLMSTLSSAVYCRSISEWNY